MFIIKSIIEFYLFSVCKIILHTLSELSNSIIYMILKYTAFLLIGRRSHTRPYISIII